MCEERKDRKTSQKQYASLPVLCLESGIAGFPRLYRRCHLKMHPVRAYGCALEKSADFRYLNPVSVFSVTQ